MNSTTKSYVGSFRIVELKSVLDQLSLPTGGRKRDLQIRIFSFFGEPLLAGEVSNVPAAKEQWRLQQAERIIAAVYCSWKGLPFPPASSPAPGTNPPAAPIQQPLPPAPLPQLPHTATQTPQPAAQTQQHPASTSGHYHSHRTAIPPPRSGQHITAGPSRAQQMPTSRVEIIPAGTGRASSGEDRRSDGKGSRPVNGKLAASGARSSSNGSAVVRCLCDANVERGIMIQCEADGCGVWQHTECLGILAHEMPEHFFCELCRAAWADPFWEVKHAKVLPPARLTATGALGMRYAGGGNELQQAADKTFQLTHSQMELIKKSDQYQLQAVCLLLNDPVPFRYHWPRLAELRINGMGYRVYSRPPGNKVGPNLRDEPASLASTAFVGRNRIRLQADDSRKFVLVVQLAKRRNLDQVKLLMAPPESMGAALQRVRRQVGAGDDDLAIGSTIMSLRDPLSGARVATPARFLGTNGLVAFDLSTFLSMAERSRKWQCPHSMRHMRVQDLQIDSYLQAILEKLEGSPDITDVEISPDADWRPTQGGYPWLKWSDPIPPPPQIKTEPGAARVETAVGNSDSEDELSEGEELRQAAKAYAKTSKRPAQEVIVLDDSSGDERRPQAKRRAVPNGVSSPASGGSFQRPRALHQPTLQANLSAFRRANGTGPSEHTNGFNGPLPRPTSSSSSGVSVLFGSSGAPAISSHGASTAGNQRLPASHDTAADNQRISIRLPTRLPANSQALQPSRLGASHNLSWNPQPSSQAAAPGEPSTSGALAQDLYELLDATGLHSHCQSQPSSNSGHQATHLSSGRPSWNTQAAHSPLQASPPSWPAARQSNQGPGVHAAQQGGRHMNGIQVATQPATQSHGTELQPPLPPSPPPPPPGEACGLTVDWQSDRDLSFYDRELLGALLFDDAASPSQLNSLRGHPVAGSWANNTQPHPVIELDSD